MMATAESIEVAYTSGHKKEREVGKCSIATFLRIKPFESKENNPAGTDIIYFFNTWQ